MYFINNKSSVFLKGFNLSSINVVDGPNTKVSLFIYYPVKRAAYSDQSILPWLIACGQVSHQTHGGASKTRFAWRNNSFKLNSNLFETVFKHPSMIATKLPLDMTKGWRWGIFNCILRFRFFLYFYILSIKYLD